MSAIKDDGRPAFPISREAEGWYESGMSLRDYFAAHALAAMMGAAQSPEQAAFFAYQVADAMLEARK